jgi:hypothetical protein
VMKDRFPDIWMPSTEQRDLRTLLRDRHQWVKMRTRLQHTLQAIALNHALREGRALCHAVGYKIIEARSVLSRTNQCTCADGKGVLQSYKNKFHVPLTSPTSLEMLQNLDYTS